MNGAYQKIGLCLLAPFLAVWAQPAEKLKRVTGTSPPPGASSMHAAQGERGVQALTAFPEQLAGAFTGGFGEETCRSCHFDNPLNPEGGSLALEGVPERYSGGTQYTLTVTLSREELQLGGFQLSARHADSAQAGRFDLDSPRLVFTSGLGAVKYVQHSKEGTEPSGDGTIRWEVPWTAPESGGTVQFSLSANAGNGDASAFGDYIYHEIQRSRPPR